MGTINYPFYRLFATLQVHVWFNCNATQVVMDDTMGSFFFKPEKNLEFFRLKNDPIDVYPGRLE